MIPPQFSHRRQLAPWNSRPTPHQVFVAPIFAEHRPSMMIPAFYINPYWQQGAMPIIQGHHPPHPVYSRLPPQMSQNIEQMGSSQGPLQ